MPLTLDRRTFLQASACGLTGSSLVLVANDAAQHIRAIGGGGRQLAAGREAHNPQYDDKAQNGRGDAAALRAQHIRKHSFTFQADRGAQLGRAALIQFYFIAAL